MIGAQRFDCFKGKEDDDLHVHSCLHTVLTTKIIVYIYSSFGAFSLKRNRTSKHIYMDKSTVKNEVNAYQNIAMSVKQLYAYNFRYTLCTML